MDRRATPQTTPQAAILGAIRAVESALAANITLPSVPAVSTLRIDTGENAPTRAARELTRDAVFESTSISPEETEVLRRAGFERYAQAISNFLDIAEFMRDDSKFKDFPSQHAGLTMAIASGNELLTDIDANPASKHEKYLKEFNVRLRDLKDAVRPIPDDVSTGIDVEHSEGCTSDACMEDLAREKFGIQL